SDADIDDLVADLDKGKGFIKNHEAASRIRSMIVGPSGDATAEPEKILLDWNRKSPKQMLAEYHEYLRNYSTFVLDPKGDMIRLYRGEWSLVSGFPGTGKTSFICQNLCHWLKSDPKAVGFAAILESDPERFVIKTAAVAAGVDVPNEAQLTSFLDTY